MIRRISRRQFLKATGVLSVGAMGVALAAPAAAASRSQAPRLFQSTTTLTLFTIGGTRWGMAFKAVTDEFTRRNPSIVVQLEEVPWADYYTKVGPTLASGSARYDIMLIDHYLLPQLAPRFTALDDFVAQDRAAWDDYLADVPQNTSALYSHDGVVRGLAVDSNTQMAFYRKDIFDKAGLPAPKTYEEVIQYAAQIDRKYDGAAGFATETSRGLLAAHSFMQALYSNGGDLVDDLLKPTRVTFNAPEGIEALKVIREALKYAPEGGLNAGFDTIYSYIINGTVAYANTWGQTTPVTKEGNPRYYDVLEAVLVPTIGGHVSSGSQGGYGMGIPDSSRNKEAAFEVIKFMASREGAMISGTNTGQPARSSALKALNNVNVMGNFFLRLQEALPTSNPRPRFAEADALYDLLGQEVAAFYNDQKSAEQALADAEKAVIDLLKKGGHNIQQ